MRRTDDRELLGTTLLATSCRVQHCWVKHCRDGSDAGREADDLRRPGWSSESPCVDLPGRGTIVSSNAWYNRARAWLAFALLLAATACVGLGFGLTVPAVNTFTAQFHPGAVDRSVLVLNALLGLGTALAPVFVAIFVGLGAWVGLPILAAVLLVALLAVSVRLPLRAAAADSAATQRRSVIPATFWVFAAFAVLYGFCETMNGNWSQFDLTELHVSATTASVF